MSKIIFYLSIILLISSSAQSIEAAGIGVSPAIIYFNEMLRGGYAEDEITISVSTKDPVIITGELRGEVAEWITFEENFEVKEGSPGKMKLIIQPPLDIPNGNYKGFLRITTSSLQTVQTEGSGSSVQSSLDAEINIEIIDEQIIRCKAGSVISESSEQGFPTSISFSFLNQGNVRITPTIILDIWDKDQKNIIEQITINAKEILPTIQEMVTIQIPTNKLPIGQYWADFRVEECENSDQFITFDVKEKGSLSSSGILHTIDNQVWVDKGNLVEITAVFENTGESQVPSKFRGVIELGGKVIELTESEQLIVGSNQKQNFTVFFTPKEEGRHIIRGTVIYGNKKTFEKTGIINVLDSKNNNLILTIVIILAAIALLVTILIKRSKRKEFF